MERKKRRDTEIERYRIKKREKRGRNRKNTILATPHIGIEMTKEEKEQDKTHTFTMGNEGVERKWFFLSQGPFEIKS